MLRIHEVKLKIGESLDHIPNKIIKKLGRSDIELSNYNIIKESIDARDKGDIKLVYTIDFTILATDKKSEMIEEEILKKSKNIKLEKSPNMNYQYVEAGYAEMPHRPVIVGFGPCGMFAALILSEMGYRPIVFERGKTIEERILDVNNFWENRILDEESNVQFGEGGAGAFSDGKLTTQIKDPRIRKVLEELVLAGGSPEILYKHKPHIGTDVLTKVVTNIRKKIIDHGGEIHFKSKLTSIKFREADSSKVISSIIINNKDLFETDDLVLAIGHSARDTFRTLYMQGINMTQKPFSIGVRIEHPQSMINEAQYGKSWQKHRLEAADYKLSYRCENGRGVYTFCMCPGGHVIAATSQNGSIVTNGMSYQSRDSRNANSALLVDVRPEDFPNKSPLAGIEFQEKYEALAYREGGSNYNAPAQRLGDFLSKTQNNNLSVDSTYNPGVTWTDISKCLPDFAVESMKEAIPNLGKKLKGFDTNNAIMTGVETRSSSPIRIVRGESYMSNVTGLYPAGEGAGYAGGIVSAAVDGIKVAEEIAKKYKKQ